MNQDANKKGITEINSCYLYYYGLTKNELIDVVKYLIWAAKE